MPALIFDELITQVDVHQKLSHGAFWYLTLRGYFDNSMKHVVKVTVQNRRAQAFLSVVSNTYPSGGASFSMSVASFVEDCNPNVEDFCRAKKSAN